MKPSELRKLQEEAMEMPNIPIDQQMTFTCRNCGSDDFELESRVKMGFDRLDPQTHVLLPQTPALICKCGRRIDLDAPGDAILTRDMKLQLRKLSTADPGKT